MAAYTPLKFYFDQRLAERLSRLIERHDSHFNSKSFIAYVAKNVEDKELKARVDVIATALQNHLPADYERALSILLQILGPENETEEGMFTNGYFLMPVAYFVEKYGHHHFHASMLALMEITKRHTSEYAIRPYLELDTDRAIAYLQSWITDSNPHVRRLVSEGTRPRLPWAKRIEPLQNDPGYNLHLLEQLLDDPSAYVQKSVANHINDLTKDHPQLVINWLETCLADLRQVNERIIKHGLRTLIKQEENKAVQLLARVNGFVKQRKEEKSR
ncbi:DNA alkylation repair protein [Halalkalibacter oceani]|uniref:DNA alkylation repair protein n=1 Tax=Halalkalibacter oceani TaxID=1653776 RepID=UPI003390B973